MTTSKKKNKKDEKMEEELWNPKLTMRKTTKRKSYLQQPTKPLHFKPNFESIQKVNSNHKVKQKLSRRAKQIFKLTEILKRTKMLV